MLHNLSAALVLMRDVQLCNDGAHMTWSILALTSTLGTDYSLDAYNRSGKLSRCLCFQWRGVRTDFAASLVSEQLQIATR